MRVVLIGQAAFGSAVLKRLLEAGHEVVGISAPAPPPGTAPDPLWAAGERTELPLFDTRGLRDQPTFERYAALRPDINVMAFVTEILRPNVLETPALGTIQYHPSLLPRHRGMSAMNWAIIKGEARTGLTIFWVDAGIDTGPVLLQKEVDVDSDETLGSLYFNKLFDLGVDALLEAVDLVRAGTASRTPQDEGQATYEPPCTDDLTLIDWSAPADQTYNLIRGSNPQPGAVTSLRGAALKVYDMERLRDHPGGSPGSVLEIDDGGVVVALSHGALRLKRVAPAGSAKMPAAEWASRAGLSAGESLGA
jgi:methionyl-tRNA formyltransferase